ncbi:MULTISPECIES: hypothetical protein [Methylobacterium]|nr:hypothetical protein [Methylobacterium sp.]
MIVLLMAGLSRRFLDAGYDRPTEARTFSRAYEQELANRSSHELFVASLYQHMIDGELEVRYTVIDRLEVLFCGTPDEYETLRHAEARVLTAFDRPALS